MPPAPARKSNFAQRPKRSPPTPTIGLKLPTCCATWRHCVRGDVHRLRAPRSARGHEQQGSRYAVVVQSDALPLSTLIVAPTSTSARPASFRPEINLLDI